MLIVGKPIVKKPQLVNRGSGGLLGKLTKAQKEGIVKGVNDVEIAPIENKINNICEELKQFTVDIKDLIFDPLNTRLHPERNLEVIKESLMRYGQLKPIVVRRSNNVVVAGNGTLQAAKELGWTKIAANKTNLTTVDAAGFGMADNKSAELAKWNFKTIAIVDRLLQENKHPSLGWTVDELEVLRMADFTPPEINDDDEEHQSKRLSIKLTKKQRGEFDEILPKYMEAKEIIEGSEADFILDMCQQWCIANA